MPWSNKHRFRPRDIPCSVQGCPKLFSDRGGLKHHIWSAHRTVGSGQQGPRRHHSPPSPSPQPSSVFGSPPPDPHDGGTNLINSMEDRDDSVQGMGQRSQARVELHPLLNGSCMFPDFAGGTYSPLTLLAHPCNKEGDFLPEDTPPPAPETRSSTDYTPFESRIQFEVADFLYHRVQMSAGKVNELMQLWAAMLPDDHEPPFASVAHLHDTIDEIVNGDVAWQEFAVSWKGSASPSMPLLSWQIREYPVIFRNPHLVLRNQLGNPDFVRDIDFVPKRVFGPDGRRIFKDFMSGDWVWAQAVRRVEPSYRFNYR